MANYVTKKEFNELVVAVSGLTEVVNKLLESDKKAPTKKTTPKKSEEKSEEKTTKTREERLTDAFGDIDKRRKHMEMRKRVDEEFKRLRKESDYQKSIPSKKYHEILVATTESLNGKWSAKAVKEAFDKNAKVRK